MTEQLTNFFTIEMIYLWVNIAVIPLWFLLIFFPQSKFCNYFITSIFPFIIFSAIYIYLIYYFYTTGFNFIDNFNLYLGLDELINLLSDESFLILFWIHFLAINLFCGSWIVRDSQKLLMSKNLVFFPLIITYFIGPIGIFVYWILRIFFAKKISLYD